jgi:uncharacterized protein YqiB (DUF1249 family)
MNSLMILGSATCLLTATALALCEWMEARDTKAQVNAFLVRKLRWMREKGEVLRWE